MEAHGEGASSMDIVVTCDDRHATVVVSSMGANGVPLFYDTVISLTGVPNHDIMISLT